jgi:endo-1,4-beta-xylanase
MLPTILILWFLTSFCFFKSSVLENDIAKYRKGEITVKAKPGSKVKMEQVAHEFWFGCAISDGMFNGYASKTDVEKCHKEKFLENFNSAVTENAVKWPGYGTPEKAK